MKRLIQKVWELMKRIKELFRKAKALIMRALGIKEGTSKKLWKIALKYSVPAGIGVAVCYYAPLFGCALASVPMARWIKRKLQLEGAALSIVVQLATILCLDWLWLTSPLLIYFLAIRGIIGDWDAWCEKALIVEAAARKNMVVKQV